MKMGYARVSTRDQNLDLRIDALKNFGREQLKGLNDEAKEIDYSTLHPTTENNKKPRKDKQSVTDIANVLGISKATFYRYLDWAKKQVNEPVRKNKDK